MTDLNTHRLRSGVIAPDDLRELALASAETGDGHLALPGSAGAEPGPGDTSHVLDVSALTGRIGGVVDLRPLAAHLDQALRGVGGSGRSLVIGLDDGRGDVLARRPDIAAVAHSAGGANLVVDGEQVGYVPGLDEVPDVLMRLVTGSAHDLGDPPVVETATVVAGPTPIVGWFDQDDGAILLGAVVPERRLPSRLAEFLGAVGRPIVITPHAEILLCDLTDGVAETVVRVLAPMGLIFDAASPWAERGGR